MGAIITRVVLYMLWAVAAMQVALIEARHVTWQDPFSEWGFVETLQSAFLAASLVLLLWIARARAREAQLALCGALAVLILLIRENDQLLELFLPHGAWKWIALPVAIALLWTCLRHRDTLGLQARSLSSSPPFGVYLAAGSTLVFSRLFGSTRFWEAVMGERYFRPVKNTAEEGVELFALGLVFAATLDWLLWTRRASSSGS